MIQNRIRNGAQKNIKKTLKYLEIKQHNVWINQNSQFYILNSMGQKKKKRIYTASSTIHSRNTCWIEMTLYLG